jgi:ubiquitin-protein ligase
MTQADPRTTRLMQEYRRLSEWCAAQRGAVTLLGTEGSPPVRYTLQFACQSPSRIAGGQAHLTDRHTVIFVLPAMYPMRQPMVAVTTPVVHPNIWTSGQVCLGGFWSAGATLDQLAAQMWRILVWDPSVTDPDSAANGEAANWYRLNHEQAPFDRIDPGAAPPDQPAPPRISWSSGS